MTVVADVLATFRADFNDFNRGIEQGRANAKTFGSELENEAEKLGRVHEAAGIAATVIGGAVAESMLKGYEIAKEYNSELERMHVTFDSIMGGSAGGTKQIHDMEEFANKMGQSVSAVAGMSKSLEVLTQGQHDTRSEWQAFTDDASALGLSVDQVANSFGRVYEMMQRSGSGAGGTAMRGLLAQGLISPETANQVTAMAKSGADINDIWSKLISGAERFHGAGDQAANTMQGLRETFHNLISSSTGEAFRPLIAAVEDLYRALNKAMESRGFTEFIENISNRMESIGTHVSVLSDKITTVFSKLSSSGFDSFVNDLKKSESELGLVIGLLAEFGTEFIGKLPIIRRFSEPFMKFLEDGRGGLIGILLTTRESREALVNFAEAALQFGHSLSEGLAPLDTILHGVAQFAAGVLNALTAILQFVEHSKAMLAVVKSLVEALLLLKIIDTVTNSLGALSRWVGESVGTTAAWRNQILSLNTAHAAEKTAIDEVTGSVVRLNAAKEASGAGTSVSGGVGSRLGGLGALAGIGGGLALSAAGGAVGGHMGSILTAAGTGATLGATLGSVIPGVGTAIGGIAGAGLGGLAAWGLGGGDHSAKDNFKVGQQQAMTDLAGNTTQSHSDYTAIQANARQTHLALQDAQDKLAAANQGGVTKSNEKARMAAYNEAKGEVDALTKAVKDADAVQTQFAQNVSAVSVKTGKSFSEIADKAKEMGINLDKGGHVGADAVARLSAELVPAKKAAEDLTTAINTYAEHQQHLYGIADAHLNLQKETSQVNITQIQQAEDIRKFTYQQTQAHYQSEQAVRSLTKANESYVIAQAKEVDGVAGVSKALGNGHLVLGNYNELLASMTTRVGDVANNMSPFVQNVRDLVGVMQPEKDALDAMNLAYQEQSNQLTVLNDKLAQYQTQLNKPLSGTRAADDALHSNDMQQKQVQAQIAKLMAEGQFSQGPQVMALQTQLAVLQNQGQQLSLGKDLTLGDQQYQLKKMADASKEIDFKDAKTAAMNVKDLQGKINDLNETMQPEKTAIDELNGRYTVQNDQLQNLVGAINNVEGANQGLMGSWEAQQGAIKGVADAEEELRSLAVEATLKAAEQTQNQIDNTLAAHKIALDTIKVRQQEAIDSVTGVGKQALDSLNEINQAFDKMSWGPSGGSGSSGGSTVTVNMNYNGDVYDKDTFHQITVNGVTEAFRQISSTARLS